MARIVLATIGSLGDLHPFIAIGRALTARGHEVVLGVPDDNVTKVRAAGLNAKPILPGYISICERLGISPEEAAARVLTDTDFVVDQILLPSLRSSTAALDTLSAGADVVAGSIFAFASEIVAEKRGLPLASIVLQPMTLFSAWQPPIAPSFGIMRHFPRSVMGRGWNRALYAYARTVLRRRHASRIDAVRVDNGLPPSRGAPMLDFSPASSAVVCCWSRALGALPPDAPLDARLTGFPFFDSESGADDQLNFELETFLDEGPAPLVFTLGSFAVAAAGRFYDEAIGISRALGMRAVMLTGRPAPPRRDGECLLMNYAPHSEVFPRAAAIIHHGGIGTVGQALRAGRPQIVVPHFGDQFDNAARIEATGIGLSIRRDAFNVDRALDVVQRVTTSPIVADRARRAAEVISGENGAGKAAHLIASLAVRPA